MQDYSVVKLPELHQVTLQQLKKDGFFMVAYMGAHGIANALNCVVEAAQFLENEKIHIILVGGGSEKAVLEKTAQIKKLKNITFLPSLPKPYIPLLLSYMDAVYIGLKRQPLFRFGVSPNKMMDYMMAGKPVINAIEAGNDLVQEARCGISIPAEKPEAIAEAILRLQRLSEVERKRMGKQGQAFVLRHHDYKVLAKKFLKLI